ncbi:MAG: tRNA dihydrouridine synthase DusB [Bacteroidetes bacterium]|nr:tRNA dihydrouridine synthase DusB [Bacteroidota bacterium]
MLTIGPISMERPLLLAPMEDVTDPPFRRVCKRLGADIVYTEFISSEGLIRDARRSNQKLKLYDDERPVSIQIFGGNDEVMAEAAQIAEAAGPDFIDINCGCWVKNVVARNAGAALLRDLPAMERIARTVVDAVKLPVTLKTRLGWDRQSIRIVEVAQMLEQAGIQALAIHCRTRDQGHEGIASWEYIEQVKRVVNIPVILNGDVKTPEDVRRAFDTGADAVMIGRAAIGNPWLFGDAKRFLATGEGPQPRSLDERIGVALDHLNMSIDYKGDRYGIIEFRKYWGGYLHSLPLASAVRKELVVMNSLPEIEARVERYREEVEEFNRQREEWQRAQDAPEAQAA